MADKIVIPDEHKVALQKAADKTADAAPKTPNAVVSFFMTVFLPLLPALLKAAAPKILANPKLIAILQAAKGVIDGILADQTA